MKSTFLSCAMKSVAVSIHFCFFLAGGFSNAAADSSVPYLVYGEIFQSDNISDIKYLSPTQFVAVTWTDPSATAPVYEAKIGTIVDGRIIYGPSTPLDLGHPMNFVALAVLSPTQVVLTYDRTNHAVAAVGTISGDTISFGQGIAYIQGNTWWQLSIAPMPPTRVVVAYNHSGGSSKARVGDLVNGSLIFGDEFTFNNDSVSDIRLAPLSENQFAVAYHRHSTPYGGNVVIGHVSGQNIAFGPRVPFNDNDTPAIAISTLTPQSFIVAYADEDSSIGTGKARIGAVSGTDVTFGPEHFFSTNGISSRISVANIAPTRIAIAFGGDAVIGDWSGESIQFGNATTFSNPGEEARALLPISDKNVLIAYGGDGIVANRLRMGKMDCTGISFGAGRTIRNPVASVHAMAPLSESQFVVAYSRDNTSQEGMVALGTVVTNSVNFAPGSVFSTNFGGAGYVTTLSPTQIVVAYSHWEGAAAVVGTLVSNSFVFGAETIFNGGINPSMVVSLVTLSPTQVVAALQDGTGAGLLALGTINGTNISFGNGTVFSEREATHIVLSALNAQQILLAYGDKAPGPPWDSAIGTAMAGTISNDTFNFGPPNVFMPQSEISEVLLKTLSPSKAVLAWNERSACVVSISNNTVSFGRTAVVAGGHSVLGAALSPSQFVFLHRTFDPETYRYSPDMLVLGNVHETDISFSPSIPAPSIDTGSEIQTLTALTPNKFVVVAWYSYYRNDVLYYTNAAYVGTLEFQCSPTLEISKSQNEVSILWEKAASNFILERTDTFVSPPATSNGWVQVPSSYQTNETKVYITVPEPGGNQYYRLRKP